MCCAILSGRPGGDLLSRVLRRSTIGAEGFHGRVRNGIGCLAPRYSHQVVRAESGFGISGLRAHERVRELEVSGVSEGGGAVALDLVLVLALRASEDGSGFGPS